MTLQKILNNPENYTELPKEKQIVGLGDCLELLKQIKDNSISHIITDPPYFIDGMDNNWNDSKLQDKKKNAGVIKGMPVGMKFDPKQGIKLQQFMEDVSAELFRVLKPGGFYICFSEARLYHRMAIAIENSGFEIRDMFAWQRNEQPRAFKQDHFVRRMKISDSEKDKILKSLNNRKTPQLRSQIEPMVFAQKPKEGTFVQNWLKYETGLLDVTQTLDGKFPGTLMNVAKPTKAEKSGTHLTVKPVKLIEHLIKIISTPNSIILDPFVGSGTTLVACARTGRQGVGIEINKTYYDLTIERIKR